MVERIEYPHRPVQVHGVGRLPDGQGVPVPTPTTRPDRRAYVIAVLVLAVVFLAVLIRSLR